MKETMSDKHIRTLRHMCVKFNKFSLEELQAHIATLEEGNIYKDKFKTIQHRSGVAQKIESIGQEYRAAYMTKTWNKILTEYKQSEEWKDDKFVEPLRSMKLIQQWLKQNNCTPDFFNTLANIIDRKLPKRNSITIVGPSNSGKTYFIQKPLQEIIRFVGQVSNVNTNSQFAWQTCILSRLISIDEALFAPEHLDKYKQISGGEKCTVDKKFSTPVVITRTPVILTANVPPWRTNAAERTPLLNRTHYIQTSECPWLKDVIKDINPICFWAYHQATQHPGTNCDHFYTAAEAIVNSSTFTATNNSTTPTTTTTRTIARAIPQQT